jgi:Glucodextranase, domain B
MMRAGRLGSRGWIFGVLAMVLMISASFVHTAVAEDFDFDRVYPNNDEFEAKIREANKACLPDPFPLIEHNYGYRLADGLMTECVTENMSASQAAKYTILALAAATTGPVGIAAAGYTMGEASSDGMKCILKALVSASSGLTPEEKISAKSLVDVGAALKDWNDFAENVGTVAAKIPELAKPEHVLNLKSAVEAGAAVYERTGEAGAFIDVVSEKGSAIIEMAGEMQERAARAVADFAYGETNNRIAEAEQAILDCGFDEALKFLEEAKKSAEEECRSYGINYRLAEVEFRSHIYRNRRALRYNNALFDQRYTANNRNPQQNDYHTYWGAFSRKRESLARFAEKFDVIKAMNGTMFQKVGDLYVARSAYETAYGRARSVSDAGGGETVCTSVLASIRELSSMLDKLTPGCRDKLFTGSQEQIGQPDDIAMRYNNGGRVRSQEWWREVDRIRESFAACDTEVAEERAAALQADIANRSIFLIENGQCRDVSQDVILEELAGLSAPESCPPENSHRILPSGLFVSSDEAGLQRVSQAVAGQELYVHAGFGVTGLERSDVLSAILEATLSDGRRITFSSPSTPVRPDQEAGYRATASLLLPEDAPLGACRVTGRIRWGGLGADAGEASFGIEELQSDLGELVLSPTPGGSPERKYAVGDPINAAVDVGLGGSESQARVSAKWVLTLPDGGTHDLQPGETSLTAGKLTMAFRANETTPLGVYRLDVVVSVGERTLGSRSTSFELVPLFEDLEILITDAEENPLSLELFRPNDPLFVLGKMTYNSADPTRQTHITIDLEGPDAGIRGLGVEVDHVLSRDQPGIGVGRQVPAVIREGVYTATITLDGGAGQRVTLTDTFQIIYPVQFDGIWTLDRSQPPQLRNRFSGGDEFDWFMRYRFVDARPDDQYSSAVWSYVGDFTFDILSSGPLGPDTPRPGQATTNFTGLIPLDQPAASYELAGVVWYNEVAYFSPTTAFKIGQEPTLTITSPRPGFEVDAKVMVVTGTCADRNLEQAQMMTNGDVVPIKLVNGEFTAKTVLRPGQNDIAVMAVNDVGESEASVWGNANIRAAAFKVVLSWEAQGPDIDLWVEDPQGKVTNYHHSGPSDGRTLDVDDRSGPGMETYTIEVPVTGTYDVAVHYYAAKGWQGEVPFRLQFTTWEGTFSERRWSDSGTLYVEAGDSEKDGAVVHKFVSLQ